MSTILGALRPWIEAQVLNQLELPKSTSKVIELVFKIEFITVYKGYNSSIIAFQVLGTRTNNVGRRKVKKKARCKVRSGLTNSQV